MRVKIQEETFITSLTGTVFIHGLFFAHEQEPKDPPITVGSTDEEYFPKKKTKIIKEMKFNRDAKF